jgi:two-component system NtrC family sensor kinase
MRDLKLQLAGALLVILTVAAIVAAGINFQQQKRFRLPEDGVTWTDRIEEGVARVVALHVVKEGAAERAGVRTGDVLKRINSVAIRSSLDVTGLLVRLGAWNTADYTLERGGIEFPAKIFIRERVPDLPLYYQYAVGVAYLAIGVFVYFRRGSSSRALHFYVLCLVSFVFTTFHYTGKLNVFDKGIYWGNVAAGLFAPTIFLHFCGGFPSPRPWLRGRLRTLAVYLPATVILAMYAGFASGTLRIAIPLIELRWLLDRLWMLYLAMTYLLGAWVAHRAWRRERDPIVRQQLKWLRNGAVYGVLPFTLIYAAPYVAGLVPPPYLGFAVLSLILIPLTWAYAILRYRLMDVDVIFQQGYAYTLAAVAVLGIFYGLVASIGSFEELNPSAMALLMLIAILVFQPVRNWIQAQLERYYFKERYDYRRTLLEFGRELATETDLDAMLHSAAERLLRTLPVAHVAFFLADEGGERFRLRMRAGDPWHRPRLDDPDLSFLKTDFARPYLFFEQTRHMLDVISRDLPPSVRQAIGDLDLTYYFPCAVRGRIIAYLGVSRTTNGDFLSSDDLELLVTLCGSIGIAVENARLYQSLQRKVEEYERLKEFSENIVESINVGILAADLEDRVEHWNTRLERLTGIPREQAAGRRLAELFPAELMSRFDAVRGESGIHHVYKFRLRLAEMPYSPLAAATGNGDGPRPERLEAMLNLAIAPLITRDGEQVGRLIILDDITERSELESRLLQADKLSSIGLLAAGVAHEVNTPLAVISTYAQMLAKQISRDDPKTRLLEKIANQTFRASNIVNSLLNFSRTSPTEFEEVDLNRSIRETLSLIEHQLEKHGVRVRLDLDEALPPIRANFGKMQQVFLNLFLNARDAMEGGGELGVVSRAENSSACVTVSDSGKGIPPEHLSKIYDPFFTTKPARQGTGLGLAVTYGIVRENGGTIEVVSQPGAGAEFRLRFPSARKLPHA